MTRGRALGLLRAVVALVILAAVVWAVAGNWQDVSRALARADPLALLSALALAVVGPTLTMLGWRVLMADLGSRLHVAPAAGIFFVGQLGKYLPGSVWSVLAQAEMGARLQIPRRRSAVVGLLSIGLAVLTGLLVGLPALPLLLSGSRSTSAWWLLPAVPLVVVVCSPGLLNLLTAKGLRLLRREPLEHELSGRAILVTVGLFVGSWLCFGAQTWILARSVGGVVEGGGSLGLASVAGYALAATIGMLAVIAPAGVGVREALLVLLLQPSMPRPAALAVVLLSRFAVTVGDVLLALAGWLYAQTHGLLLRDAAPSREA